MALLLTSFFVLVLFASVQAQFCPALAPGVGVGYPGTGDTCGFRSVQLDMPALYQQGFVLAASQDFYNQKNTQFDFKLDCDTRIGQSCGKSCGECVEIHGPAGVGTYIIQEICDAPVVGSSCFGPTVNLNVGQQHSSDVIIGLSGNQQLTYKKVPCPVTGNLKVYLPEPGSNQWSLAVTPFNFRVGIAKLEVMGRADAAQNPSSPPAWLELPRDWTNKFVWRPVATQPDHVNGQPQIPLSTPFDVRVTSINGEQIVCQSINTAWVGGTFTVYDCGAQFSDPNCNAVSPSVAVSPSTATSTAAPSTVPSAPSTVPSTSTVRSTVPSTSRLSTNPSVSPFTSVPSQVCVRTQCREAVRLVKVCNTLLGGTWSCDSVEKVGCCSGIPSTLPNNSGVVFSWFVEAKWSQNDAISKRKRRHRDFCLNLVPGGVIEATLSTDGEETKWLVVCRFP